MSPEEAANEIERLLTIIPGTYTELRKKKLVRQDTTIVRNAFSGATVHRWQLEKGNYIFIK